MTGVIKFTVGDYSTPLSQDYLVYVAIAHIVYVRPVGNPNPLLTGAMQECYVKLSDGGNLVVQGTIQEIVSLVWPDQIRQY